MNCRHCNAELNMTLVDLGSAPPSNAYLTEAGYGQPEKTYPLRILVCTECWLVQTEDFAEAHELFNSEYAYFSGISTSWLEHSQRYVKEMIERFSLGSTSCVIEVAANDGYLLQYVKEAGIPCIGVEPTASTAASARAKGIPIVEEFFGINVAKEFVQKGTTADLTVANNVLAHVPDINDFVSGFTQLLKPNGVSTFEFPHLLRLLDESQFDTIYHEHFSYLSLTAVDRIFEKNDLRVFDVQELPTHGGSLRVFAQRADTGTHPRTTTVSKMLATEEKYGLSSSGGYSGFQAKSDLIKDEFLAFLQKSKQNNKTVVAYGAAAKGNTLMNYAGVNTDLISTVIDRNPAKQNKFMPGSKIPIVEETWLTENKPEYIVILPWNLRSEIMKQLEYTSEWGAKFVTAVPCLEITK